MFTQCGINEIYKSFLLVQVGLVPPNEFFHQVYKKKKKKSQECRLEFLFGAKQGREVFELRPC